MSLTRCQQVSLGLITEYDNVYAGCVRDTKELPSVRAHTHKTMRNETLTESFTLALDWKEVIFVCIVLCWKWQRRKAHTHTHAHRTPLAYRLHCVLCVPLCSDFAAINSIFDERNSWPQRKLVDVITMMRWYRNGEAVKKNTGPHVRAPATERPWRVRMTMPGWLFRYDRLRAYI